MIRTHKLIEAIVIGLLFGFILSSITYADEVDTCLQVNIASKHINPDREFNEANYGAGLLWDTDVGLFASGAYKNSIDNISMYLLYGVGTKGKWIRYRLFGGVVSGYGTGLRAALWPVVSIGDKYRINIGVLPETDDNPNVLTFQAEIQI